MFPPSKIYFYDPDINKYFEIPYRNIKNPKINLYELRNTIAKIKADKRETHSIDETTLFQTYHRMKKIEENSKIQTKKARRQKSSKKHLDEKLKTQEKIFEKKKNDLDYKKFEQIPLNDVKPELFTFDLIEED